MIRHLVPTSGGPVEVVLRPGPDSGSGPGASPGPVAGVVLYFHGGHESAGTASASGVYVELGYTVLAVSRPGYGATDVGPLSPRDFAGIVDEVREHLGFDRFRSVVGTSFGGSQAIAYAGRFPGRVRSLVLHSAAPSTLAFPEAAAQRLLSPVAFHPRVERFTWGAVSLLLRAAPQVGLRLMVAPLSTRPPGTWLPDLTPGEREELRDVFRCLRSGGGFVIDVRHGGEGGAAARRRAQGEVGCPTLVTASRSDRGVSWRHAEDFLATVPDVRLAEIPAPCHLFWIGPGRPQLVTAVRQFLEAPPA